MLFFSGITNLLQSAALFRARRESSVFMREGQSPAVAAHALFAPLHRFVCTLDIPIAY